MNNRDKFTDYEALPLVLEVKDIQNIFHCGRNKAYQIMNMSGFPSFRIDSSIYVEKNELKKWLARVKNRNVST